jgi:predicted regulator of Ras-like GTPase activity (Roadblock/LC7/MglB family)
MLKKVLEEFLQIDGVKTAALISRDGFVIELAGAPPADADALGALGSSSARFFDSFGHSLEKGPFRKLTVEYAGGTITISSPTSDEFLAIITGSGASAGRINYLLAKAGHRVAAAM